MAEIWGDGGGDLELLEGRGRRTSSWTHGTDANPSPPPRRLTQHADSKHSKPLLECFIGFVEPVKKGK